MFNIEFNFTNKETYPFHFNGIEYGIVAGRLERAHRDTWRDNYHFVLVCEDMAAAQDLIEGIFESISTTMKGTLENKKYWTLRQFSSVDDWPANQCYVGFGDFGAIYIFHVEKGTEYVSF